MKKDFNVNYVISLYPSKSHGYQTKKGRNGKVISYISTIWKECKKEFFTFTLHLILIIILERYCLERAFNRIRIKGRMCNPCCVENIALKTYEHLLDFIIEE
ncbi:MAG: hypothetical protein ACFFG0_07555 [Candidatus Thorarchaeota archaeon]